jgi:hypothetical protein
MQPEMRFDKGALWENYLITERFKQNHYEHKILNTLIFGEHMTKQELIILKNMMACYTLMNLSGKMKK